MFNPDDENDRQAAIRRDRDFTTMDAVDRLAWANAASTPAERKPSDDTVLDKQPGASGGAIELDTDAIVAANLSPDHRLQILEAERVLKRHAAEAHLNPAVRRDSVQAVESARLLAKPFLKK